MSEAGVTFTGPDRRAAPRIASTGWVQAVRLARYADDPAGAICNILMSNRSAGGLRGSSPVPLDLAERLVLFMPPSEREGLRRCFGEVVRCDRTDSRFDVAVAFAPSTA